MRALLAATLAAVLVMVVVAYLGWKAAQRYDVYLGGLWAADPGFLEKAQLGDFQLFISPPAGTGGRRQGYLIMTDLAGGFLANGPLEIAVGRGYASALAALGAAGADAYTVTAELTFDDATATPPPLPARAKLVLSMLAGTLTISDDEKVYAFLEKDSQASAAADEAYKE